jgi:hypothetical protein
MNDQEKEMLARFTMAALTGLCASNHGKDTPVTAETFGETSRKIGVAAYDEWKRVVDEADGAT